MEEATTGLTLNEALSKEQSTLYAVIFTLLGSRDDVMDVLQDTNVAILEHAQEQPAAGSFLAWFKAIAMRQVKLYRRQKNHERLVFDTDMTNDLGEILAAPAADSSQEEEIRPTDRDHLSACLKKLPKWERDLLRERYENRTPVNDLAKRRSVTRVSLSVLMFRIRKALRDCIEKRRAREVPPEEREDARFVSDLENLLDGKATDEEKRDFTARMRANPALKTVYVRHATMHAFLDLEAEKGLPIPLEERRRLPGLAAAVAVACLAVAVAGVFLLPGREKPPAVIAVAAPRQVAPVKAEIVRQAAKPAPPLPAAPAVAQKKPSVKIAAPAEVKLLPTVVAQSQKKEKKTMQEKNKVKIAACAAALFAAGPVQADGVSSSTSAGIALDARVEARSAVEGASVNSRTTDSATSAAIPFNTRKIKGTVVMLM